MRSTTKMKSFTLLLLTFLGRITTYSQIDFEKGYYIDNNGERIDGNKVKEHFISYCFSSLKVFQDETIICFISERSPFLTDS
jgi:hypothetical protein